MFRRAFSTLVERIVLHIFVNAGGTPLAATTFVDPVCDCFVDGVLFKQLFAPNNTSRAVSIVLTSQIRMNLTPDRTRESEQRVHYEQGRPE